MQNDVWARYIYNKDAPRPQWHGWACTMIAIILFDNSIMRELQFVEILQKTRL